jgi:hypothetical protein
MKNTTFKLAELFCGPGGLSLGLISAQVKDNSGREYKIVPLWANDIDEDSCKTYARNIHGGDSSNVVCAPVETIDFSKVPRFDVLAFGFALLHFLWVKSALATDGYRLKLVPRCFSQSNIGHVSPKMPKLPVAKNHQTWRKKTFVQTVRSDIRFEAKGCPRSSRDRRIHKRSFNIRTSWSAMESPSLNGIPKGATSAETKTFIARTDKKKSSSV